MGTTHADHFQRRPAWSLTPAKSTGTERTGLVIIEAFTSKGLTPAKFGRVKSHHAPFAWGVDAERPSSTQSRVCARRGRLTSAEAPPPDRHLIDKHYLRNTGRVPTTVSSS
jgi:hypothetical protein